MANAIEAAVPLEDPERGWLENVFQREARQLTVRAVIAGMVIGAVMCLSNLYVVLKTGWSVGVTITACIIAFAFFSTLRKLRLVRAHFTPLENNAMGSVASAAGYMTGGGNMAAIPALLMVTGAIPDPWLLMLWFAAISALGVFVAIPIKRQLVNIEKLPFPTGTATAETIRALHGEGQQAGKQSRYLFLASLVSALIGIGIKLKLWWNGAVIGPLLPAHLSLPFNLAGKPLADFSLYADPSVLLIGGGGLMSWRTGWSLLLGGAATWAVIAPLMHLEGAIPVVQFKEMIKWTLWPGAAILASSGILSFAFEWRAIAKSFRQVGAIFGGAKKSDDPMEQVECPGWWFPLGFLLFGPVICFLASAMFGIPWWAGVVSLALSIVMGFIAARVTGETDVTPTKGLGPVTQMLYGVMLPKQLPANLMGANITGGVGLHAADLLTDLKSGYLLGAKPRQQFYAQMFGVLAGAAVIVPVFKLIIQKPEDLGGKEFPAPGAQVWKGVSLVLVEGIGGLHRTALIAAGIGVLIGVALSVIERYAPKKVKAWVPSPAGLGIAMIVPFANSLSFFIGAGIAEYLRRRYKRLSDEASLPVASGFLAGESLIGVAHAMLVAFALLPR